MRVTSVICLFLFIHNVFSLRCHVTDTTALQARRISVSMEDCDHYITEIMRKFNIPDVGIRLPNNCYTMKVNTNDPSTNFEVKGCVPKNMCSLFVPPIVNSESRKKGVTPVQMQCSECTTDGCNS